MMLSLGLAMSRVAFTMWFKSIILDIKNNVDFFNRKIYEECDYLNSSLEKIITYIKNIFFLCCECFSSIWSKITQKYI